MNEIVVPISDPAEALGAADQAIARYRRQPVVIHLINVQRPLPRHVSRFFGRNDLRDWYRDSGMRALQPAIARLEAAGVPHDDHVLVGKPAEAIVQFAEGHHCDEVLLDVEAQAGSMFGLGSLGSQVRHLMGAHSATRAHTGISTPTL
jgi:hypothetical protein